MIAAGYIKIASAIPYSFVRVVYLAAVESFSSIPTSGDKYFPVLKQGRCMPDAV